MKPGRLFAILILCVTVALAPGALAGEKPQSRIQPLIEQAVISYAAYGERDNHALMELSDLEPSVGEKWTHIMDLWEAPVTVNGELPDGLPEDDTLCLVALGFQLNPDGTMKEELIQRLKAVLVAAEKYPHALIVCTGGGTAADDPTATEAGRMAEWLEDHGVDPSRLIVEDHSLTTAQNAIYTFDILDEQYPQVGQLAIISSDYHIATGVLLFGAEAILRDSDTVVAGNASWHAPSGTLSTMFQAGALIELSGDVDTAFEIYYDTYDIHELPSLQQEEGIVNGYDETPGIETTADQETMTLEEYLERSNGAWFPTGKKEYTVNAMMVSKKTSFHNELEVADYTVTDDGITVILKGVFDEMWPTKLDKVMEAYTKPDGSTISEEDFARKDSWIQIITKSEPDSYFAMFVPLNLSVTVETAWGDVLHTNLPNAPHGHGDYLVCRAAEDGEPDLTDIWVVNGVVFPEHYDTDTGN